MGFNRILLMVQYKTVALGISVHDHNILRSKKIYVSQNHSVANFNSEEATTYSKVSEELKIDLDIPWIKINEHYVLNGTGIVKISIHNHEFIIDCTFENHMLKNVANVTAMPINVTAMPINETLSSILKTELHKYRDLPAAQIKDELQNIFKIVEESLKRQDEDSANIVKNQSSELNERLINPLALYNPNSEKVKPENPLKRVPTKMSLSDTSLETASENSDDLSNAENGSGGVRYRSPKRTRPPEHKHQIKSQKAEELIESSGTISKPKLFLLAPFMLISIFIMIYNFPASTNLEVPE